MVLGVEDPPKLDVGDFIKEPYVEVGELGDAGEGDHRPGDHKVRFRLPKLQT